MFVMYDGHMKNSNLQRHNRIVDISGETHTHTRAQCEDMVNSREPDRH